MFSELLLCLVFFKIISSKLSLCQRGIFWFPRVIFFGWHSLISYVVTNETLLLSKVTKLKFFKKNWLNDLVWKYSKHLFWWKWLKNVHFEIIHQTIHMWLLITLSYKYVIFKRVKNQYEPNNTASIYVEKTIVDAKRNRSKYYYEN